MSFDRSKFKATSVNEAITKDEELNSSLGRERNGYTGYLKLNQGQNLVRIYPPHPEEMGGGSVFAEPKVTVWLPMMVPQRNDQGEVIMKHGRPEMKESSKSVFNSRIHGGTEKDLVEEYVNLALENLEEELKTVQDSKEKQTVQDKIDRIRGNWKLKIQGLYYKQAWAIYADLIVGESKTFGTLEIGKAIKERLNSISISTDQEDGPIATDPFTDPDSGRAVVITYNKEAKKPQDYYKVELDSAMVKQKISGQTYNLPRIFQLSDEQLESFMEVEPLAKRFHNAFSKKDFDLQLEGLDFFDRKHNIGLFDDPQWISICEEIVQYYPEIEDEQSEEEEHAGDQFLKGDTRLTDLMSQEEEYEEEEEDAPAVIGGDEFDDMSRIQLTMWHKKNKTGLIVKPSISDEELREFAREYLFSQGQMEEEEEIIEDENEEQQETKQVLSTGSAISGRLAALKKKTGVK